MVATDAVRVVVNCSVSKVLRWGGLVPPPENQNDGLNKVRVVAHWHTGVGVITSGQDGGKRLINGRSWVGCRVRAARLTRLSTSIRSFRDCTRR